MATKAAKQEAAEAAAILSSWKAQTLDRDTFIEVSKRTPEEQIAIIGNRLNAIEKAERETFYEKGAIVVYVERTRLWEKWPDKDGKPYHSFDAWMGSGGETCRTSRYDARTFVTETADLPPEEVKKIARKNSKKFLKIPKHRRREPKVLKAAQTLSKEKFERFVEEEVPEAHTEPYKQITFNLERSSWEVVNQAIEQAIYIGEAETKEQILEAWAADFLQDHLEAEGEPEAVEA